MHLVYSLSRYVLVLIALCTCYYHLSSQCNPPDQLPTQQCQDAPLTCLQNACYSTQTWNPDQEPAMWCGPQTAIHNPQYFLFQATSTTVQINIHVNDCGGGGCGLQSAIIDTCSADGVPWTVDDVLVCDDGEPEGGTMMLIYDMMVIGEFYWLMIDGCSNDICEYTIDFVAGIHTPGLTEELSDAGTDFPVVCQGQDEWTAWAEDHITGAHGYLWTGFPWAPGYHTSTFVDMSGPDDALTIPDDAAPGVYEICVVAFSGCDTTDIPVCFNLEIVEIEDGISPDVILCPEDYENGVVWEGLSIPGPGTYTIEFETPEGCPYDSIKTFDEFPTPDDGVIDTVVCAEMFTYEGVDYEQAGSFDLFYDDGNQYGCDSFATLNLDLIYLEVETDFLCEFTQFTLTSQVILAIPGQSGISYEWYQDGLLVSEDASFQTFEPGCYDLFVSYEINGVECTYPATTNPVCINLEELVPEAPTFTQTSGTACALDFPMYCVEENPDVLEFVWTGPDGLAIFPVDDECVEVSWQGFTGGQICVHAVNHCGVGPDTCFNVDVIPSPVADFEMPTQTCVDTAVTIEYSGQASMDATFIWNFGSGAMIHSGGTGPGPHSVSWPSPGFQTVTVQVIEAGCDTADISYDIFVELLGQPLINCTSDLNSITFTWNPVVGASGYNVTSLMGPSGVQQADTSYIVSGLSPGTTVQIQVIALGVGACNQTMATLECIAQSCPPKVLAIQLPTDTVCLGDVSGPLTLSATVDGVAATGTWSGPGVDPSGTFDATVAGPGQHAIVFTYDEGTCSYNRQATIYVFATATADFTLDAAICQDGDASVIYTGTASLSADFSWNFGSATVLSGTGAGPFILHWNTPGDYQVSLTVTENTCVSEVVTHMIDVQPTLTIPVVNCFPTTSSVMLEYDSIPNGVTYTVNQLFGQPGTLNGNQFFVGGLVPGDSVAIELIVTSGGLCPDVTVVASCVARNCPTPTFAIDPVDDICLYAGTQPVDVEITITNGNGTGVWSGPGIVDVNEGIFNPNVSGAGSHTLQFTYLEDGCSFVESITVDVFAPPVANISNTDLVLTCENGSELELDGSLSTAPGGVIYAWSTTDGVLNPPLNLATVTASAPGTYDLLITDMTSGCEDMVSVTLIQDAGVPVADAGPDGLLNCNIDFVVLGGASSSGPEIQYMWTSEGGDIVSDPNAPTITVTSGGVYELLVTNMDNGCTSVDEAIVNTDYLAPMGLLEVGEILDCDTETTPVTATITPGTYSYAWETTGGVIQSGAGTSEIIAGRPGVYTLIVTNTTNGCMDTISVEVLGDDDIISAIQTVVDDPKCVGDVNGSIVIETVTGGNAPYTYAWSNQGVSEEQMNLPPGTYTVTITDQNGCRFIETFTLPTPLPIDPDIGPNLQYDITEIVTIALSVTDSASIESVEWSGVAPACAGCFQISFPASESGEVLVMVTDTNGCTASTSINLTVFRPKHIFIPNVFSPNGDSVNDVFRISGNTIVEIRNLRIFNRWGSLVHEELVVPGNTSLGWDGKYKDKEVNPGVFVFMAEVLHDDGKTEIVKGDITVVK